MTAAISDFGAGAGGVSTVCVMAVGGATADDVTSGVKGETEDVDIGGWGDCARVVG